MTHPAKSRTVRRVTPRIIGLRMGFDCHDTVMDMQEALNILIQLKRNELGRDLDEAEMIALYDFAYQDIEFVLENVHPVPRSVEYILHWKKRGHDISFVSMSNALAHAATCLWLNKHRLGAIATTISNTTRDVPSKAERIGPDRFDAFVENNPKQAASLCKVVRNVFLLDRSPERRRHLAVQSESPGSPILVSGYRALNRRIIELTRTSLADEEEDLTA